MIGGLIGSGIFGITGYRRYILREELKFLTGRIQGVVTGQTRGEVSSGRSPIINQQGVESFTEGSP